MGDEKKTTWVDVQKRAFTRWANGFLSERMLEIKDIEFDLEDGRQLLNLLEVISSKTIGLPSKNPKTKFQKVENLNKCLNFISGEGIKLVGIGAEDIFDHKLKLILGLIWTLILRFHINMGEGSPKWELLQWVRQQVKPYAVDEPNNFTKDWMDGKVLYALVDSIEPGIISPKDLSSMTGNPGDDVEKAMQTAKDSYHIPRILDVTDMTESPDELAMMTYVSYFREYLGDEARRKRELHAQQLRTADAANCYADGPGLEKADTYKPAEFCIHARNCFGGPLDPAHGGDNFVVAMSRDGTSVTVEKKDNGDGDYPCTYVATVPGAYEVRITLDGTDIKNSPYKITIYGPSAANTKVTGKGVEGGARVGEEAPILITAVDQDGNPVTSGGDPFAVKVDGPQAVGNVPVKDNGDGTHSSGYKVDKPGRYTVDVTVRDEAVAGSPFSVLIENGNAGKSWAEGPGLEGGKTDHDLSFTIHSVDADGKPASTGGDPFQVKISGPADVEATVTDNGDGTYGVTYNPEQAGDYTVAVTLHDEAIKDAPFSVTIKTSPNAGNSWAEGEGLEKGQEDKPSKFVIHAVDKNGEALTAGGDGDEFTAKVAGPNGEVPVEMKDNGDGTYDCSYTPNAPGEYEVNVAFGDKPIKDMPCKFSVKAAACPPKSYAEGPGVVEAVDNEPATFTIYLLDKEGVQRVDGGDDVKVVVTGVSKVEPKIVDNNDGTYSVEYEADEPGAYTVEVTCDGEHIKDSPFAVPIKEGTAVDNCGFGQFTFTVQSADRRGNPKTFGGDKFEVKIKNKEDPDAESEAEAIDNGDGTYTAKYTLAGTGTFFISVSLNGKAIKGSPFKQKL